MQDGAEKEFRLALDDITKLIDAGRDKGHLTHNDVKDLIPHDVHSPEELDDLLTTIGMRGIDVLESQPKLPSSAFEKKFEEEVEGGELDLTPDALEKTNDPVRIYLRAMGIVPLLTREGEVDMAKRIERGQLSALKALSRSPLVIRQILVIGEDLKRGIRSIKEIVVFDEEGITEATLRNCVKNITQRIDEVQKHYKRATRDGASQNWRTIWDIPNATSANWNAAQRAQRYERSPILPRRFPSVSYTHLTLPTK